MNEILLADWAGMFLTFDLHLTSCQWLQVPLMLLWVLIKYSTCSIAKHQTCVEIAKAMELAHEFLPWVKIWPLTLLDHWSVRTMIFDFENVLWYRIYKNDKAYMSGVLIPLSNIQWPDQCCLMDRNPSDLDLDLDSEVSIAFFKNVHPVHDITNHTW